MPAGFFFHFTIGVVFLPHVLYSAVYCTMIQHGPYSDSEYPVSSPF